MRDKKGRAGGDNDPLVTQFREHTKVLQEACAPLVVFAQGKRPPKLQVKPESSKSASSQSGSAITASKNGSGSQVSKHFSQTVLSQQASGTAIATE